MGKNVTIQEGGVSKQMTVDKLKTNLVGGGNQLWVPEDSVELTTKNITENGTYRAEDDGYFGYSEVTVNGVGVATGKDSDGDDVVAHTGSGGLLEVDKLPSKIVIIEPPTQIGYINGETIKPNGMIIKAYLASGGEYGAVPISEITLEPTTAVYDESTDTGGVDVATSDLDTTPWHQPIAEGMSFAIEGEFEDNYSKEKIIEVYSVNNGVMTAGYGPENGTYFFLFASSSNNGSYTYTWTRIVTIKSTGETRTYTNDATYQLIENYTNDEKTVYYAGANSGQAKPNATIRGIISGRDNVGTYGNEGEAAWTMIYGDIEQGESGSHQEITVKWPRPTDGKVLTDTFEILVTMSADDLTGGDNDGGTSGSNTGGGVNVDVPQ